MNDSQTLETLRRALDDLRSEVERLRVEVGAVRSNPGTSLRSHNKCPMCDERSVLHVREIRDRSSGSDKSPMALQINGVFAETAMGVFQAYICRGCDFAEWYMSGAGDIDHEKLDKNNRKNVSIIDGQLPTDGVYR